MEKTEMYDTREFSWNEIVIRSDGGEKMEKQAC